MLTETVDRRRLWLDRRSLKSNIRVLRRLTSLPAVARRTGSDDIGPYVRAAEPAGDNVVDGQNMGAIATILARVIISPEYLSLGKAYLKPGTPHHVT